MDTEKIDKKSLSYKTVFVQNIPISCTNEHLKEVFSTIGSIQEAFVVPPKDREECINKRQSLVGFVTYFSHDDAEKAVQSRIGTFAIEGRRMKVKFAGKKKFSKDRKRKATQSNITTTDDSQIEVNDKIVNFGYEMVPIHNIISTRQEETVTKNKQPNIVSISKQKENVPKTYAVSITGFPETYMIQDFVKIWKSKGFALPEKFSLLSREHGDSKFQEALVELDKKQAALKILTNLSGLVVDNNTLVASLVLDPNSKEFRKTAKRSRMIIRNLSFRCTEKDLRKVFSK